MADHAPLAAALVLAQARAWIGTPHRRGGALRGVGADCVGLLRGLVWELAGETVPAPPWRPDWADAWPGGLARAIGRHAARVPLAEARPGHVVTFRLGAREAHAGILEAGGRVIHAAAYAEAVVRDGWGAGRLSGAWALLAPASCATGPAGLDPAGLVAVIHPAGPGARVVIQAADGTRLARSGRYASRAAALAAAAHFPHLETVE
jgi:NlpC/P60 family putative phage cell wall peptidase